MGRKLINLKYKFIYTILLFKNIFYILINIYSFLNLIFNLEIV